MGKIGSCKRGHLLSGDNLYINPGSGSKVCKTCRKIWTKRYKKKNAKIVSIKEGSKICSRCNSSKRADEFRRANDSPSGLSGWCKDCMRDYSLEKRYGLTREEYELMVKQVNGRCEICNEDKPLHVDHCHSSGVVRGLLCFNCNSGIGQFKDSSERVKSALAYLGKFGSV